MPTDDVNDFLLSGGVTSAKFETPGTTVSGTICRPPEKQQQRDFETGKPKVWEDGSPRWQIVIHLQTDNRDPDVEDDDGIRALYVRGNMLRAVREAVRRAGGKLEEGGYLDVIYTGDGERQGVGFPPKLYSATYIPAAQAAVADALDSPAPASAKLPPGVTAEQWAELPQAQKEAAAALYGIAPY